ncbi:MAG: nitroreductase family protein [Nocardioides sp.]
MLGYRRTRGHTFDRSTTAGAIVLTRQSPRSKIWIGRRNHRPQEVFPMMWSGLRVPAPGCRSGMPPGHGFGPDLIRLLTSALGATTGSNSTGVVLRAVPSAGARYPVEAYLVCGKLPGMCAGVHWLDPLGREMQLVRAGDMRSSLAEAAGGGTRMAAATIILTGCPRRTTWKYGPGGFRQVLWDVGAAVAALTLAADSLSFQTYVQLAFDDGAVGQVLSLGSGVYATGEVPLALLHVGDTYVGTPSRIPSREKAAKDLESGYLMPSMPDARMEEVNQAHHSSVLRREEVEVWRDVVSGRREERTGRLTRATDQTAPPPPNWHVVATALERRRSQRTYGDEPLSQAVLKSVLAASIRDPWQDIGVLSLAVGVHVLVHRVSHSTPGVYEWKSNDLLIRRQGSFRNASTQFCQRQAAAGRAGALLVVTLDINRTVDLGGARGYRVAQIQVGAVAARAHLSATVDNAASTILTMFEEDARHALDVPVEPQLAVALGVRPERS